MREGERRWRLEPVRAEEEEEEWEEAVSGVWCRLCRPGQRAAGTPAGGAAGGGVVLLQGGSLLCGSIVFLKLGNNRAIFLEQMESFTSAIIICVLLKYYLSYFLRKRIRLPIFNILLLALVSNVISWIYLLKIKLKIHIFYVKCSIFLKKTSSFKNKTRALKCASCALKWLRHIRVKVKALIVKWQDVSRGRSNEAIIDVFTQSPFQI